MKLKKELDRIDRNILKILQKDARISYVDLASKIGLSTTPCMERIKKLEREQIILSYNTRVNPAAVELGLLIFVEIKLAGKTADVFERFQNAILDFPNILECHLVSGNFDYLIKARISEISAYRKLLGDLLRKFSSLGEAKSYIVMDEVKETQNLPIYM